MLLTGCTRAPITDGRCKQLVNHLETIALESAASSIDDELDATAVLATLSAEDSPVEPAQVELVENNYERLGEERMDQMRSEVAKSRPHMDAACDRLLAAGGEQARSLDCYESAGTMLEVKACPSTLFDEMRRSTP